MLNAEDRKDFESMLKDLLMKEWKDQGHYMNGKVVDEMEIQIESTVEGFIASGYTFPYALYQQHGVSASNIPYGGGKRGDTSKYIEGLIGYVQKRMAISDLKEAKSIAFAIAKTHKKEGMPSMGSAKYSPNGKRTGWISDSLKENETSISGFILRVLKNKFEETITAYVEGMNTPIILNV
jgi:hypothetical protein